LLRKRSAIAIVMLLALAAPAAALAGNGGVGPPSSNTPSGDAIREVYWVVLGVCAFAFVVVEAALITFIVRFRRRRTAAADLEGPQIHGNTRLEIAWTVVPALILAGLAAFALFKVPAVQANPSESSVAAGETVNIDVIGHQFYWQYEYPNGAISLDTLYVPAGRTTSLHLRTEDVNHSWWVPELTGKLDLTAGRENVLNFKPRDVGTFEGTCAEFCGIQHAVMQTKVEVLSEAGYQAWLARNAPDTQDPVALGKSEWESVCAKCHNLDGSGLVGPSIAGNSTMLQVDSLRDLLYTGQDLPTFDSYMPAVGAGWSDRQLEALVAYLKSNDQLSSAPQQLPGTGGSSSGS